MKNQLLDLFYAANAEFLKKEMHNVIFNVSERSLCSSLAHHLYEKIRKTRFADYHVDTEYNRNGINVKTIINEKFKKINITCDLIIHSRGEKDKDNLLAIEMKKSNNPDKDNDRDRLIALTRRLGENVWYIDSEDTNQPVCDYELGIFYEINVKDKLITLEIYSEGKLYNIETKSFEYYQNYQNIY